MSGKIQVTSSANVKFKIVEEKKLGINIDFIYDAKKDFINQLKNCITSEMVPIEVIHREKKVSRKEPYKNIGIKADSVNRAIRKCLIGIDDICFETNVEYGGFFERNTKSSFDFSVYDRIYNYCEFWNYNRNNRNLENILNDTIQENDASSWKDFLEEYNPQRNVNVTYQGSNTCNIVGEIQMGNWAMIYKDMFRLLRAKNSVKVNLYIYITNTGLLKKKLSDNIVTYKKALLEFQENLDIIDVPMLIIAIDIDEPNEYEFKKAYDIVKRKQKLIVDKKFTIKEIKELDNHGITVDIMENLAANYMNGEWFENDICRIGYFENNHWIMEF